jgi:hypothetical protein
MLGENGQNVVLERDLLLGCFRCPGDAYEQSDARQYGTRDGEAQHDVNSILSDGAPTLRKHRGPLEPGNRTVRLPRSGNALVLNGFGKGYS